MPVKVQSKAKYIDSLIKKEKVLIGSIKKTRRFKEPVLFLLRTSGDVETYENVQGDEFVFDAIESNQKEPARRRIQLHPRYLLTFQGYSPNSFRGYFVDERNAFPYPTDPVMEAQTFNMVVDKTLNDINSRAAKEDIARGKKWSAYAWAFFLCVIAVVIFLWVWATYIRQPEIAGAVVATGGQVLKDASLAT